MVCVDLYPETRHKFRMPNRMRLSNLVFMFLGMEKKIKETIHIAIYGAINGLNSGINISREHKDAMKHFHQNG